MRNSRSLKVKKNATKLQQIYNNTTRSTKLCELDRELFHSRLLDYTCWVGALQKKAIKYFGYLFLPRVHST